MDRREASKRETRKLILNAAKKLFREEGVDKCTMRRIAKKAGVSPASVVVHFNHKTGLLEAALFEDIDRTIEEAIASSPSGAGLQDQLLHIWGAMFHFYDANRDLYRALIRKTMFEPDETSPRLRRQMNRFLAFLAGLVEGEKKRGHVRPEVDGEIAAMSFTALYFGVLISFFRDPGLTPAMALDLLAALTRQHMAGVSAEKEAGR